MTSLLPALAGANLIYGLGMIEMGMTFDFGQLVLDNEVAQMIRYALRGIPVTDETLAVDVIKEIGIGKDYLSHASTLLHMRRLSAPRDFDRSMFEDWEQAGRPDIYEKATQKARNILETHTPDPLPGDVQEQIQAIVAESEAELGLN